MLPGWISENPGWWASWAGGAAVILLFAHDQLNRPLVADPDARRRARLLEMFAPAQLRNQAIFLRGYLFYALLLLMAFTLASALGGSVLRSLTGGGAAGEGAVAPLGVALMMVGLLPRAPFLDKLEERFRLLAYRLVGVPATFYEFTDALLRVELDADAISERLVGPADAARLRAVLSRAETVFGPGPVNDRFAQGAMKLFAFRAWSANPDGWPGWATRSAFRRFEIEIAPRVDAVVEDLEDLALRPQAETRLRVVGAAARAPAPATPEAAGLDRLLPEEHRWRALAGRVAEAAEDACALCALYAEKARERPTDDNPVSEVLRGLIERAERRKSGGASPLMDVLIRMLLTLAAAMFVVGWFGQSAGFLDYGGVSGARAGMLYAVGVLVLYGPASFQAWSARQEAARRSAWRNAFAEDDVFPTLQYLGLFLGAWAVATASLGGFILFERIRWGMAEPFAPAALRSLLAQAAAYGAMGGWHAIMMALAQDLCAAAADRPRRVLQVTLAHAGGLAALCWLAAEATGRLASLRGETLPLELPLLGAVEAAALASVWFEVAAAGAFGAATVWLTRRALGRVAALG